MVKVVYCDKIARGKKKLILALGTLLSANTALASAPSQNYESIDEILCSEGQPCERPSYFEVREEINNIYGKIKAVYSNAENGYRKNLKKNALKLKGKLLVAYGSWYDAIRVATNKQEIDKKRFEQYSELIPALNDSFYLANELLEKSKVSSKEKDNLAYFYNKMKSLVEKASSLEK